jgi:cytochrome c biogenesis protein CcmG, thiol:disulfide interchange protein DsbE
MKPTATERNGVDGGVQRKVVVPLTTWEHDQEPGHPEFTVDDTRGSTRRNAMLGLVSMGAITAFGVYAASIAARAEEIGIAEPITVPGQGPKGPFGTGLPAPDFALPNLEGQTVKLSDFAGRPVWINIWASWCAPCRAEMPDIEAVYQEMKAKDAQAGRKDGLAVLLVSLGEDPAVVRRYMETTRYELPVLLDPNFQITERYRINGLPTHYFVGRDQVIKDFAIGGLKPKMMRTRIDRIL